MAQTHPKALPTDLDFYAKRIKEKANPNVVVADKINKVKDDEINDNLKEIDRIRTQKLLDSVRQGTGTGTNPVLAKLFEGKTTEQITDMLNSLTPEALDNLTKLASRFDSNPLNQPMIVQQPSERRSGTDELILVILKELIAERNKPQPQQNAITLEGVAALIQAINSGKPVQIPASASGGMSPLEVVKMVMEFNRPVQEQLKSKDKELVDAKLREMEARMPPDLAEQIKYVKEMAPMLGLTGGQTNELDLRLEEMRENREVDMKRLDWEQEKYKMEQENDSDKWDKITHLLEGPLGDVIKSFGNAGADRVRGATKLGGRTPKPVQTQCPNCQKPIFVDANADSDVCGNCGAILQKQPQPEAPSQPSPEPTHVDAPPAEATQPAEPEELEEEEPEEVEEEKEVEHTQRKRRKGGTDTVESETTK